MDMLKSMTQDELNGNLGKPRKAISSTCIARFYEHLAAVIDTDRSSHRVWTSISIKQMDQLRTYLGGRPGCYLGGVLTQHTMCT